MPRLRILINGAGIAGSALAHWLSKVGHDVTVVERFPDLRTTGLQLDLRDHGVEVLKRMGPEKAFREKIAPEQGLQIVDRHGRQRGFFPVDRSDNARTTFTTNYEIMRGDFCRILYDSTKDRAKYIFGAHVTGFEQTQSSVHVQFANGQNQEYDIMVGADGQNSRIRKMLQGPGKPDTAFYPLGSQYVAYFSASRPIAPDESYVATMYMDTGKRGIMTRRHNPHEYQVYIGGSNPSDRLKNAARGDVQEEKEAIAEIFKDCGWKTKEIVADMMKSENFYCERLGVVKMDTWFHNRVVLVGDAAYCPSATTGKGTTSAIVGAYILAGEIARCCDTGRSGNTNATGSVSPTEIANAFRAYEDTFRPYMTQVQAGVLEAEEKESMVERFFATAPGIVIMNYLIGAASFFKWNVVNMFLRGGVVKDWSLPEYAELE